MIDEWVKNPGIDVKYIRSIHPNESPGYDYIVGFIHGNIE